MALGSEGDEIDGRRSQAAAVDSNVILQRISPVDAEAVLKETGLSFVLYDLRHTFATRAAEGGMQLATLAAILGHGNLRSVMKYVHISQEHMDREMMRLERISAPTLHDLTIERDRQRVQ